MKVAPEVLPPAFYPVGLNLAGRRCVVIGLPDDKEAIGKARDLREAGADVTWLHDPASVVEADLAGAFFVLSTPQDARLSAWLRELADRHRFLLCTIDQPAYGFVAMQAQVKSGAARIAISTGGISPRVGGILRAGLQSALDATFARFLTCLAHQRRLNRARNADDAEARRATMMSAADGFDVAVQVTYPQWFLDELAAARPQVVAPKDGP
jgi:siroheme synthase (precorrin-2 oxidase/ferrochelatase)